MSFGWTIDINADSGSIKILLYYDPKDIGFLKNTSTCIQEQNF